MARSKTGAGWGQAPLHKTEEVAATVGYMRMLISCPEISRGYPKKKKKKAKKKGVAECPVMNGETMRRARDESGTGITETEPRR